MKKRAVESLSKYTSVERAKEFQASALGFRLEDSGFMVQDLGLGFRVQGSGFRFRVHGAGFRFRVQGGVPLARARQCALRAKR